VFELIIVVWAIIKTILYLGKYSVWINFFYNRPFLCLRFVLLLSFS